MTHFITPPPELNTVKMALAMGLTMNQVESGGRGEEVFGGGLDPILLLPTPFCHMKISASQKDLRRANLENWRG